MQCSRRILILSSLLGAAFLLSGCSRLDADVTASQEAVGFIRTHLGLATSQCPTSAHKIQFWMDLTWARISYDAAFDVFTGAGEEPVVNVSDAIALNSAMIEVMRGCNGSICGSTIPSPGCEAGPSAEQSCKAAYNQSCFYCDATCTKRTIIGPFCGDRVCQSLESSNPCNPASEPPNTCQEENWFVCPADCTGPAQCPNGRVEGDEQCDDGNTIGYDGCSSGPSLSCRIKSGYYCLGSRPSVCTPIIRPPQSNSCQSFHWNLRSATALPSSGRAYFGAAVHEGKMWVVGGKAWAAQATNQWYYSNEVLSSDNGIDWTVTGSLPIGVEGNALVSYAGKLWSIGGYDGHQSSARQSIVFSSADGVTWEEEWKPNQPSGLAFSSAVVFGGKLWVIGRVSPYQGSPIGTVYSFDGTSWKVEQSLPENARGGRAVVHNNAMVVFGGGTPGPYYHLKTTYRSLDGITWERIGGTYVLNGFDDFEDMLSWNGQIWQIGKFLTNVGSNQAVYSTDGIHWTTSCPLPTPGSIRGQRVLEFQDKLWILGGAITTQFIGSTAVYESVGLP